MLDKQFIQDYFNADFRDIDSLLNDVLVPIFGSFDSGYDEITLSRDAKEKAAQSRIKKIKHVATLPAMGMDIKVFDVTLDSRCHIHRARKGIQMLIRQYVEKFEGAFIVFHYEDPANRSWRFSYLEKRESNVASTNAKRYTYLCGKQYPCRTLAERFEGLQKQDLTAINLEKAFSVETLSDEFFNEYRNFYQDLVNFVKYEDNLIDGFVEYAKGDKELAEKYARDYIKKLMGRLVFIQFLQNKAWLKEDIHYTHTLFNSCTEEQKYDFLDNVLEPLFFGVFNTPKDAREVLFHQEHWDMNLYNEWKDFPYLNGGLFECDELDKLSLPLPSYFFSNPGKEDKVRKPNDEYYSDACGIFDFFDRYNFTIDESDPLDREIGVDPEMLGKIFENLLEDNKDKGAFYTPKEIVDYMCKEALTAYLIDEARKKSEVNKQRQENFEDAIRAFVNDPEMTVKRIQQYDDKQLIDLDDSLRAVKICDPAIGSGAFPMGLLNLLMACRTAVNDALRKGEPRYLLKKEIIQNNIYGVDIEKGAIDIARLRFWLSIVVDLEEPEALPNFDYKFMQGNSLLEQYQGVDLSTLTQNKKEQHEALQVSMFDDQLDILRETLRKYLDDYFLTTDHQIKTRLRQQIKDNVNQQLHEQHIRVDFPEQYDIAANTDFFLWHTWFADVFNRPSKQGFDIVIGNPPYGAKLSDSDKKVLKAKYASAKTADGRKGSLDTFSLFIELGYLMLAKRGYSSFIVPLSVTASDAMSSLHQLLFDNCETISISSYGDRPKRIFESAEQQVSIISFQKTGTTNKQLLTTHINKRYSDDSLWILLNNLRFVNSLGLTSFGRIPKIGTEIEKDILRKMLATSTKLGAIYDNQGKAVYYRKAGGRYYKIITTKATGSSAEGYITVKSKYYKVVAAILSSDLFYWFWLIHSDWHNLRTGELEMVPIPIDKLTDEQITKINTAYDDYQKDLYDKCKYTKTGLRTFVARQSKPYINVLDDILCPLYGLSPKETEFIKNFEMEFRATDE